MRLILSGALVLSACVPRAARTVEPPQVMVVPVPAPVSPTDPVAGALGSAGVALGLPRERQVEEIQRWSESLDRTQQPTDRLRLAMLLTLGDPRLRDPDRVRELLHDQSWSPEHASYEMLARMLLEVVETRADSANHQRRSAAALATETERCTLIEQQLEALKAVETDMDARAEGLEDE